MAHQKMAKFKIGKFLLILYSLWSFSCQKHDLRSTGKIVDYVAEFPVPQSQNVNIDFVISYDTLSKWIYTHVNNPIFKSSSENEFIGFPIEINLIDKPKFSPISFTKMGLKIPVNFISEPKIAGFAAGKVNGKLQINTSVELDGKSISQIKIKALDYDYQWLEKPMVKVAGFAINAAPVIDKVLMGKKDELFSQYSNGIKNILNEKTIEKWVLDNLVRTTLKTIVYPNAPIFFDMQQLKFQERGIQGQFIFNTSFKLLETEESIRWMANKPSIKFLKSGDSNVSIIKVFSWDQIELYLSQYMLTKLNKTGVTISIKPKDKSSLQAVVTGFSGKKSNLRLGFNMVQIDSKTVGIDLISKEISQLGWPRNMFKAIGLKRLDRLASQVKLDLNILSSSLDLSNLPIKIVDPDFSIRRMHWNDSGVFLEGNMLGHWTLVK